MTPNMVTDWYLYMLKFTELYSNSKLILQCDNLKKNYNEIAQHAQHIGKGLKAC